MLRKKTGLQGFMGGGGGVRGEGRSCVCVVALQVADLGSGSIRGLQGRVGVRVGVGVGIRNMGEVCAWGASKRTLSRVCLLTWRTG